MFDKNMIRNEIRKRRDALSESDQRAFSKRITDKLTVLNEYVTASTVLLYASVGSEVYTMDLIQKAIDDGKEVGLPVVEGPGKMEFYSVFDLEDLTPGKMNIPEPPRDILLKRPEALCIVPGVSFDQKRNRTGYGGGYYDRYFARFPKLKKIGLAYDCQLVDAIPADRNDVRVDMIVTENQIII